MEHRLPLAVLHRYLAAVNPDCAALFDTEQGMVFGGHHLPRDGSDHDLRLDPNAPDEWNVRTMRMPAKVISSTLHDTLGWRDAAIVAGDAVDIVARSKRTRTCRCARRPACR